MIDTLSLLAMIDMLTLVLFRYQPHLQFLALNYKFHRSMQLDFKIEDKKLRLSIGEGYNDWVWASHYAARVYSKGIYPQGTYIPTMVYMIFQGDEYHPHPRERIKNYMEEQKLAAQDLQVIVKIRKGNHIFTDYEKRWEAQAFGADRFMMLMNFVYMPSSIDKNKDFYFKVKVSYQMSDEVKHLFNDKKYDPVIDIRLKDKAIGVNDSYYEGDFKLPYGQVTYKLFYCQKEVAEQYSEIELAENKYKKADFRVRISPRFVPIETINSQVTEDMKISENTHKSMQEKELEAKKRNARSCLSCYSFEQLWSLIEQDHYEELSLGAYEKSTKERVKITIEKSMSSLYKIFFNYFIIESQVTEKKEDLGITYQHILHFLREYQVLPDMENLLNFMEFYNSGNRFKGFRDTLDIVHYCIRFPQFIAILLRSIQFVQTSTFMVKGETFDVAVNKVIERIVEIDNQEDEFSQFRRILRENPNIIDYMRSNSQAIKGLFISQATSSLQNSASSYVLMKEEIKIMLEMSELTSKNTDKIVQDCYMELKFSEDGVFYYGFLELIQWLALAIVSYEKDEEREIQNGEEEAMLLIEKIKHLLSKLVIS